MHITYKRIGNATTPTSDQPSSRRKREIDIAKLSLTLAVIFILCHSVKWVPNIHEIIMVRIEFLIISLNIQILI